MAPFPEIAAAEAYLLERLRGCIATIQQIVATGASDLPAGVALLRLVRSRAYEDINQLQHEALLLEAAARIRTLRPDLVAMSWFWNPSNTGTGKEPDLRIMSGSEIVVSVEATASERAIGTITTRLKRTLSKLQDMPGDRFYFVRTQHMLEAAQREIRLANYAITPLTI